MTTATDIKFLMGRNLLRLRKIAKLTQEELGAKLETSASHIAQMEGGRGISPDTIAKVCNVLNVEPSDFYTPVLYSQHRPRHLEIKESPETYEIRFDIKNTEDREYVNKLLDVLHGNNQQGSYALKLIIDQTWTHRSEKKGITVSEISKNKAQKA